jgi:hypothetical protein
LLNVSPVECFCCCNRLLLYILVLALMNLTFREPYFVIYNYNKTNEMRQFLEFIFGIGLYMFRTGSLSIIRSLALHTQQ